MPEQQRTFIGRKVDKAWQLADAERAEQELRALARQLQSDHPGAAASLREGLEETLTVTRLGLSSSLLRTFKSTNPIESMISVARDVTGNVKRWRAGSMILRWTAAGYSRRRGSSAVSTATATSRFCEPPSVASCRPRTSRSPPPADASRSHQVSRAPRQAAESIVVRHETSVCAHCGRELPPAAPAGRPRRFCGPVCRAAAYRRPRQYLPEDLPPQSRQGRRSLRRLARRRAPRL